MIEGPAAPAGIQMAQYAIRQSLQHERDLATVIIPEEKAKTDFEGTGPSSSTRGSIVDISV